jgi:hypothetical protein
LANLTLMCPVHHKLIDVDNVEDHSEETLLAMKAEHEARVALLTGIHEDRASQVLRFGASIGTNEALVSIPSIYSAMSPDFFPASGQTIDLEMTGHAFSDAEVAFWGVQQANLRRNFAIRLAGRIERQEIRHLSVFALAPQPLLFELGRLLCDIVPSVVYQRHREPSTWRWQRDRPLVTYRARAPELPASGAVALKLGVSATIGDDRIRRQLGSDAAIWELCADAPHNDIIRSPEDQTAYRVALRRMFNDIKARHGDGVPIHLFPALPASLAVETGRVWMPKADPELRVYDQQRDVGFVYALTIGAPK